MIKMEIVLILKLTIKYSSKIKTCHGALNTSWCLSDEPSVMWLLKIVIMEAGK